MKKAQMIEEGWAIETPEASPIKIQPKAEPKEKPSSTVILTLALQILSKRILLYGSALGSFALFGYTMIYPDPWRFICAVGYTVLCVLPILWLFREDR